MATLPARSFADMIVQRVAATPANEAFRYPTDPGWAGATWGEVGEQVRAIASGLRSMGLEIEQRCAILGATSFRWILVDFGIMSGGGATTTIYPSNTPEECSYILNDSQCQFAFVENEMQLAKLTSRRAELPGLKRVIVMDGTGVTGSDPWVIGLAQLMDVGRGFDAQHPADFQERVDAITPEHLATLLYTSGTTGRPKGVELVHDCWLYEAEGIDALKILHPDDLQYLWLPLSHSFGKVLEAAQVRIGFTSAVDGRIDKLVDNLAEVKPTFVAAVPRVFEKVHNKVVMGAQESGGAKLAIFNWAMRVGMQIYHERKAGRTPGAWLNLQHGLADKLVYSKLRERFGGRLRFFISGSAPLSLEVAEFFYAAGIITAEGYGLTETSAATFVNGALVNNPGDPRLGTVGQALPGTEVRIAPEDGEILVRGRGVMRGYHRLPEATREALVGDGWLATGDIGFVDAQGFLKITDRKKDLIKTSGGKYVAPQALESKFKALCPYVSQIVVHGNNRNYCSALMTLDEESMRKWATEKGIGAVPMDQLVEDPRARAMVQGYVDQLNAGLASYETIKKFALLPVDFTVDAGELTASLKVKRKTVEQKFRHLLDGFYAEPGVGVR